MTRKDLLQQIQAKRSFLCVGLDSDPLKIPGHLGTGAEGVLEFNRQVVDATAPYTVAYKPNVAFYEAMGYRGQQVLEETIGYIRTKYPEIFVILDAKRGDIGNTSSLYARAAYEVLGADAVTVAPYMGSDSVSPFLAYEGRWVVLLALTSNQGSADFQHLKLEDGRTELYEQVLRTSATWGDADRMMYVVGATQPECFRQIREIVPHHFLLVPGVGAQGGSLAEVCRYGLNDECGLLVNSSRGIIFAGNGPDFAAKAAEQAKKLQEEMADQLRSRGIV